MIKKEALHIIRDKRTMLILFCIPIILMLLFGFAITTEVSSVDVAAVAPNRSDDVGAIMKKVIYNETFNFYGYTSQSEVDHLLQSGEIDAAIVFNENAEIQVILDASNTNSANAIAAYLQGILMGRNSPSSAFECHYLFNPQMKSAFNFVPGILGMIFMLICAMMTSVSIVREKEVGTMEVLLVSPVKPISIIISKMIPYFVLASIIFVIILFLSNFVLDVPVTKRLWELSIVSVVYILLSLSLGLLISTIATKQATALLFSAMVLMLPIIMLSGMIFPIENMPKILQYISNIVPARWYISCVRKLMIEGQPFMMIIKEFTILVGMLLLLIVVSLKKFNNRLE